MTTEADIAMWTERMMALQDTARFFKSLNVLDVLVGNQNLEVYVALSSEQKSRGLANVEMLDLDGMLFVFSEGSFAPFTGKDMSFDFTIAWFDINGSLIASRDIPAGYQAPICAPHQFHYVLETPRGFIDFNTQTGLKINGS